jgi:hypothetical protein
MIVPFKPRVISSVRKMEGWNRPQTYPVSRREREREKKRELLTTS